MRRATLTGLILLAIATTGCDGLRKLAGRPTSADIEALRRERMEAEEAAHQARIDSLRAVEQAMADSIALSQMKGTVLNPAKMGGLFTTKLDYKYYIVVGALKQRANAEKLLRQVQAGGYTATLISFRNGYNAVGLSPSDDLNKVLRSLAAVREEPFCPDDVWILVNE